METRRAALGTDHPDYANSLYNMAMLLVELGQDDEVEAVLRQALAIMENAVGAGHQHTELVRA